MRTTRSRTPAWGSAAMLPVILERDRKRAGWSVTRAAWELGVSIREYRELEAGERSPNFETWDRICKAFGWPQTFASNLPPEVLRHKRLRGPTTWA